MMSIRIVPGRGHVTVSRVETPRPTGRRTRRSASFISTVTFGGRVLERAGAFGQILLIAAFFGATTQSDLYFVASIVPLTFGSIMGEALYASVLPSLAHRPEHEIDDIACAGFWISTVLLVGTTLAYAAVLAVVVPMASPLVARVWARGWHLPRLASSWGSGATCRLCCSASSTTSGHRFGALPRR